MAFYPICHPQMIWENLIESSPEDRVSWRTIRRITSNDRKIVFQRILTVAKTNKKFYGWRPIHQITWSGNEKQLEDLLRQGVEDINCRIMEHGFTALYMACQKANEEMVQLLLENSADPNENTNFFPLEAAIAQKNLRCISLLLEKGANVNTKLKMLTNNSMTRFLQSTSIAHVVAEDGFVDVMEAMSKSGISWNVEDDRGWSPFFVACEKNRLGAMKYLLEVATSNVCFKDYMVNFKERTRGLTPLCLMAKEKNVEGIQILLSNGADVNLVTRDGLTALHIAIAGGSEQCIELIFNKTDLELLRNHSDLRDFIDLCVMKKQHELLKRFLDNGFSANKLINLHRFSSEKKCFTPLCQAAWFGDLQSVKLLLAAGADCNSIGKSCAAPLSVAVKGGNVEIVQILINHGSDVNFDDGEALRIANELKKGPIADVLINASCDLKDTS